MKRNFLTIHKTAKDLHDMWKRACHKAARVTSEAKEYNKQRWDKSYIEPDFKEGDQVLVSILNFKNLKVHKKMRDSFLGPFTIIKLIAKMKWRSSLQRNFLGNTQYSQLVWLIHTSKQRRISSPPGRRIPLHHK
ncbi:hypothetical protein O181_063410 [Austropuccinia psidii MF-1]|uniref:Uncharacterized protein n=1 Tax=Austropuccinia psidii MF-1 TaxID=1389203 RepID=A0A9Q3EIR9_9BASI|nr:hypothetical protein [Austropuccinia psidii MF-1]